MTDAQLTFLADDVPAQHTDGAYLSINQLAQGFSVSHDTACRRLHEARIKPSATRRGVDLYNLAAAAPLLASYCLRGQDVADPDTLPPLAQRIYWQTKNEKLKFEEAAGHLLRGGDVEREMAHLVKTMVLTLDTLPDILERDCGLNGEQVERVGKACDECRTSLATDLETWSKTLPNDGASA